MFGGRGSEAVGCVMVVVDRGRKGGGKWYALRAGVPHSLVFFRAINYSRLKFS